MGQYNKFLVAFATALSTFGAFVADGEFSLNDGIGTALAFLGALGVYAVANKPAGT